MNTIPPAVPAAPTSKTSGLAITSLVLGILGMSCLLPVVGGIAALICGIVALSKIKNSGGALTGQGLAIGGIATGAVGILLIPIMAAMLLPALASARAQARRVQCMANLKQIGLGIAQYYDDQNPNKMPAKLDDILPYVGNESKIFICPTATDRTTRSYQLVPGAVWGAEPARVMIIEPDGNHGGKGHCELYTDGHVEWVSAKR
jgi:hypothetical protein